MLLVHGTADESVAVEHADRIGGWAPEAEILKIEGAGHTFGAVHPWQGETPHLVQAMEAVTGFFGQALG
jgi:pimeloyl-ACP methyl ester carboxylesterase